MKKLIILTAVVMLSFSAFGEETHDVDGAAIQCNNSLNKSAITMDDDKKKEDNTVQQEG